MTEVRPDRSRIHHRTCDLCEAMCGLAIEMNGDEIVAIRGDEHDPLSRGHICPKAVALQDVRQDPDRLKRPLRRDGNRWEEVTWGEAFDEVVARVRGLTLATLERSLHGVDLGPLQPGLPVSCAPPSS